MSTMPVEHSPDRAKQQEVQRYEEEGESGNDIGLKDLLRARLSLMVEQFKEELAELESDPLSAVIPAIKRRVEEMDAKYQKLQDMLFAEATFTEDDMNCEREYHRTYRKLSNAIEKLSVKEEKPFIETVQAQHVPIIMQQHPLPASLPTFNGTYENWPKFCWR